MRKLFDKIANMLYNKLRQVVTHDIDRKLGEKIIHDN